MENTSVDIEKFKNISTREHVLMRTEMYVGSMTEEIVEDFFLEDNRIVKKQLPYIEGLVKIINELIDNTIDNTNRDPPTKTIKVEIKDDYVTVINDGCHIPIVQKDCGNGVVDWIPSVIFGVCLSGTNFDEERKGIGLNGLGVKLANILSSEFSVELYDPVEKKLFQQSWSNNMSQVDKPLIRKKKNPNHSWEITKVRMKPKLKLFHKNLKKENIKIRKVEDVADYVKTRLISISACSKMPLRIYYNDKLISINGFQKFIKMHTNPDDKFMYERVSDNFEYGLTLSHTGNFEHQSFVNCLHTTSPNSSHTKYVTNTIVNLVSTYLDKKYKSGDVKVNKNNIRSKIMVFVNIRLDNPVFTSQTKIELSNQISKTDYPMNKKRIMDLFKKTGLMEKIEEELQSQTLTVVQNELNSTKAKTLDIDKLDDAHNAGTSMSHKTTLFLVEGDSAKTFVSSGLSVIGRANYGVFPMKGKIINVRAATPKEMKKNAELKNIMKILGLSFDKKYDNDADIKSLRYGRLCILTDADADGKGHIAGLLISFLDYFWPSLLKSKSFLYRFDTPLIKAESKRKLVSDKFFYTMSDFDEFLKTDESKHYNIQHLKGLGTSEKKDTLTYFKNMNENIKQLIHDDKASFYLDKVFGDNADWRKKWVTENVEFDEIPFSEKVINISDLINIDTRQYSIMTLRRAIPSVMDGLKSSQRKILFSCLKKFGSNGNTRMKVAQLSSYVASITNYAHGEESLNKAIINMAGDYPGSNNMNILEPLGSFGSRLFNGKDHASPRYIYTCLSDNARKMFNKNDDGILEYLVEEGYTVEPKFYVPELPMVLINGTDGMATGYRTFIPKFNPDDIVKYIQNRLEGVENEVKLKPWFKGYSSNDSIEIIDSRKWKVTGRFKIINSHMLEIYEIPINVSIEQYKTNVLSKLKEQKKIKKFLVSHIDENNPKFVIKTSEALANEEDIVKTFKLSSTLTSTCFNLLDVDEKVIKFDTVEEIIDYWLQVKMQYVEKRKQFVLDCIKEKAALLQSKIKFIHAVVNNKIDFKKNDENSLKQFLLNDLQIDERFIETVMSIKIVSCSVDNATKIKKQHETLEKEYDTLQKKSIKEMYMDELQFFTYKMSLPVKRKGDDEESSSSNDRKRLKQ